MTTPAVRLLPCPFCGSDTVKLHIGLSEFVDGEVRCDCGATSGNHPDAETAIAAWNLRSGQLITIAVHEAAVKAAVKSERANTQAMHRRAQQAEGANRAAQNWLKWFEPRLLDARRDGSGLYAQWLYREMVKALSRAPTTRSPAEA